MWEELKVVVEDEVYLASRRTTYRLGGSLAGKQLVTASLSGLTVENNDSLILRARDRG